MLRSTGPDAHAQWRLVLEEVLRVRPAALVQPS